MWGFLRPQGRRVGEVHPEQGRQPKVVYSITRGTPTGDYTLDVYAVDPCDFLASFGHFKIDSSGHGGKTVTVPASEVGGHKEFQTEGYNSGSEEFEESMVAKV